MIHVATYVLALLNVLVFMLERKDVFNLRKVFGESSTHFSYDSLMEQKKWWVLFTATISHASLSHLSVNLTLFLALSAEVEEKVGWTMLLIFYFSMGAAGWFFTAIISSRKYPDGAWQWISSCGASPSTYGLAFWCAVYFPEHALVPLRAWSFFFSYYCICCYSIILKCDNLISSLAVVCYGVLIFACFSAFYWTNTAAVTTLMYLVLYLFTTFVSRGVDLLLRREPCQYPSSDDAAHFGGALFGYFSGIYWCYMDGKSASTAASKVVIFCFAFLICRCYYNY